MTNMDSALQHLQQIIERLIGTDGCPWDKEQTPASLCEYVLEESHELVEAIRHGSDHDVCEELGDVMFLLVFISLLYSKKNSFQLNDIIKVNAAKMIRRHPHVFADTVFDSRDEQLSAWERIKRSEKSSEDGTPVGVYNTLPRGLPPLLKAYRIHSKAARAGFTWDSDEDVEQQVEAEWLELLDVLKGEDKEAQEHELGDLIFTLVELGRRKGIKASAAVDGAAHRFLSRFSAMEALANKAGKEITAVEMDDKNALWERVKADEKGACATPDEDLA